jgi:hypothetical protein
MAGRRTVMLQPVRAEAAAAAVVPAER